MTRNMLHETAKSFAFVEEIPELNHHLMESLSFPNYLPQKTRFIFFTSHYYSKDVKRRIRLTTEVLSKKRIFWEEFRVDGASPIHDAYKILCLSGFLSFYLAILYGVDPVATPWVDYFKEKLEGSV